MHCLYTSSNTLDHNSSRQIFLIRIFLAECSLDQYFLDYLLDGDKIALTLIPDKFLFWKSSSTVLLPGTFGRVYSLSLILLPSMNNYVINISPLFSISPLGEEKKSYFN